MEELDRELLELLDKYDGTEKIIWFSEEWNVHQHISALIGHEQMHIGQIVAFCYACNINIPKNICEKMSLGG